MKKKLVIAGSTLLVLVALAGALAWYYMGKPLYEPGQLATGKDLRASLTPPAQSRDGTGWMVEQGITLHHYVRGTGRGVLVVHGGPGKPIQRPWPGLEPLSGEYAFLYYDQRGCGLSTRPIDRFSSSNYYGNMQVLEKTLGLGAQIADIERIRKILGEEKLILLGHSFGAFLASLYAAEFPDRVSALVLVAPASVLVMPGEDGGLFGEVGRLLPEEMRQEYAGYLRSYLDFSNIFSRTEAELASVNARFDKYYRTAARVKGFSAPDEDQTNAQGGWMVQAMYFSMGKRHDYRSALKKAPAPVLVIHGENDIQSERASRAYSDAFPNSTFRLIKSAGHFPFLDQPAEFAMATGEFLRGVK
ncbi:MAG: alpha/beta hydrolase [Acidobacteria bacterium]|nr:alpha/beta hydrolase [Acidobacteriota bacterium]